MTRITSRSTDLTTARHRAHRLRDGLFWTCLLLVVGIYAPRVAPGSDAGPTKISPAGPGLPFAVADFDGDHRPDLASIQSGQTNSSSTNDYWVQLRLSGSGPNSFRLTAPKGGLLIEARDVNGDQAVDLILSTAWLRQPVAILLNDGHGSFLPVAPAAFHAAFRQSNSNWNGSARQPVETVSISGKSRTGVCAQANKAGSAQPDVSVQPPSVNFSSVYLLASCAERAPPADIVRI